MILRGNRKVLLLKHLIVHTKFTFELSENSDGSISLNFHPRYRCLKRIAVEALDIQLMADIFALPTDLAPNDLDICCGGCKLWLPQLVSCLRELKDQGLRISSNLQSLRLGDCGEDHEWDWNNRWDNCDSSLIELNEVVSSMSGEICSMIHPIIRMVEGKVEVDYGLFSMHGGLNLWQ